MLDRIKKLGTGKGRKLHAKLLEDEDQQSFPLIEQTVNENLKQSTMESSIKELYKDLDNKNITDEIISEKLESLVELQEPKVLWLMKNSKAGTDGLSMLHFASKFYRYKICEILIDGVQFDSNKPSKSLRTPLMSLVRSEAYKIVGKESLMQNKLVKCFDLLISKGANCNLRDENQMTALHYAVNQQNLKAFELLASLNTLELSARDSKGLTALEYACKNGYDEFIKLLIEMTEPIQLVENKKDISLPIHYLTRQPVEKESLFIQMIDKIKNYSNSVLDTLLRYKVDENNHTILELAMDNSHTKIVEAIIKNYYTDYDRPDINGDLPIHHAADNGSLAIFDIFIKYKAVRYEPNTKANSNPLHLAAEKNRFEFIKRFLKEERNYITDLDDSGVEILPCIKQVNKNGHTPLFVALFQDNVKSVEYLAADENCDSGAQDPDGDSIFHVCAQYNNVESLRFLLKNPQFSNTIFIKNKKLQTPLHIAATNGSIDIMKMIIAKFYDGTFDAKEAYLVTKDDLGRTCLHLACELGYFNIVEYLIRDLKLMFLTELMDSKGNTPLHYSAMNGHQSITELLLVYEPNVNLRNAEGSTALELSCRKGFFDISKMIINSIKEYNMDLSDTSLNPLHMAAAEGSHEVVTLLLEKGYPIDKVDESKRNVLDIALEKEHKDVVRALLNDPNWQSLIKYEPRKEKSKIKFTMNLKKILGKKDLTEYCGENPQLYAMSRNKMWDAYLQILDNSFTESTDTYDFLVLDPPFQKLKRHPLMLLAQSGQETLLTHETIQKLLYLKWRFIPRFLFYSNLLFYLIFIVVFGMYSIELTDLTFADNTYKAEASVPDEDIDDIWDEYTSVYQTPILILVGINIFKIILQILLIDGIRFVMETDNWFEAWSIIFSLIAVFTDTLAMKTQYASIAVLLLFANFTFLIQKLRIFGVYVLAFRRTLVNSAKFMPVFLIVYIGFLLSFRVRVNSNVSVFNSTGSTSFLSGITMMMGDFNTSGMGVEDSVLNYFLYVAFIGVMSIIILNLFVGIAVGEITQTLQEADIQQISMRIVYVLKIQDAMKFSLRLPCLKPYLNMRFGKYSYEENESILLKNIFTTINLIKSKVASSSPEIILVDPQTRLEESIADLAMNTEREFKVIREAFFNQMIDVNDKLNNSKVRLEDCLTEMSRKTVSNFESSADGSTAALNAVEGNLSKSQQTIQSQINSLNMLTLTKFQATKQCFIQKLKNSDDLNLQNYHNIVAKLNAMLELDLTNIASNTNKIKLDTAVEFSQIKEMLKSLDIKMVVFQKDLDKVYQKLETTQDQIIQTDYKLNQVELMCRREPFSLKLDNANAKLDSMRQQDDTYTVPKIETMYHQATHHSTMLDTALEKLDNLTARTTQLKPDIDRIKLIEASIDVSEKKLDKALEESKKLDETLERLNTLNERMTSLEPDIEKIKNIESILERFDSKQNNLISILLEAINRKKSKEPVSDSVPVSTLATKPDLEGVTIPKSSPVPAQKSEEKSKEKDIDKIIDSYLTSTKASPSKEEDSVAVTSKQKVADIGSTMRDRIRLYEERRLEEKAKKEASIKEKNEKGDKDDKDSKDGKATSWAGMLKK